MGSQFDHIPEDGHLYVRPTLFSPLKENSPHCRSLAGGPMGFSAVELIFREKGQPLVSMIVGMEEIERASTELPEGHSKALEIWIDRLSAERRNIPLKNNHPLSFEKPHIMGVINVTPDSFSDGGQFLDAELAVAHGQRLLREGAQSVDIGGESTRPGAVELPLADELARVLPVIEGLRDCGAPISIDSRKSRVMKAAADNGASIINDVSALTFDPKSLDCVAGEGLPVILMHALGDPSSMQIDPGYDHVLLDVFDFLMARIEAAVAGGISRNNIIIDPGIGFGKTLEHNLILLRGISMLHGTGCPIMLGVSRKSFIGKITGENNSHGRLPGSLAAVLTGLWQGVQLFRVHDVAETQQAIDVFLNIVHP